jgi:drug/metabolite transporter (DMT)-like permease
MVNPMNAMSRTGSTTALFAVAVTLGGSNFLAVSVSNRELDPFWGAGLRFSLAGLLFVIIALVLRLPWPRGRQLATTIGYGMLGISVFYALAYWALVRVTAGSATVVLALVPLATLLLAAAQGREQITRRAVAGSVLAVAGIAWMVLGDGAVALPLGPLLALLGATACVSQSVIVGKSISANHPAVTNAIALITGAVTLLCLSAVAGESWVIPQQAEVRWSLAYLVVLGSAGLFAIVLLVVRRWTASATSYMFVLFPLVTMVLGAWLLGEPTTSHGVVGALVVMGGAWLGALSTRGRESVPMKALDPTRAVLDSG